MNKKHSYRRGMSIIELMISVAIIATIGAALLFSCTRLMSGDDVKKDAEKSARQYAAEMNIKVDGLSCGSRGNSNGQVYCSINSGGKVLPISCIGRYKIGNGCVPRVVTASDVENSR